MRTLCAAWYNGVALPPLSVDVVAVIENDRILLYQLLQSLWLCYQLAATWFMHVRLTALNYTTNEFLNRKRYEHFRAGNPFAGGSLLRNLSDWWTPQPPRRWFMYYYLDELPTSSHRAAELV